MLVSVPTLLIALPAFTQGTVNFGNTSYTLISTNGGGPTAPTLGGFVYGLFTAASTVTTIDPSLQDLLTSTWTFTGVYATNSAISTGGRLNGGLNVPTLTGWDPGATNSYMILGWSANLGTTWAALSPKLTGAHFFPGVWVGGGFAYGLGWLGASSIAFGAAGGGASGLPAFSLISTAGPTGQGTPISTGFSLYPVVPEPSSIGLLAVAVLLKTLTHRRRSTRIPFH